LHGAEQIGEVRGQVYEHNDLANLYMRYGNLDAARAHVRAALALNRENFLAYGRVFSLDELGQIDLASGQPRMAVAVLDSARRLADSAGFGRERVTSRAALARAEIAAGDAASALRWGASAVQIADSLGDPEAQAEAREANATVLEKARVSSALGEYERTIALLESWRGRLALGDLRMGVVEPRMAAFEGAIRILVHNGRAAEAFDIAERARARLLLELMAEHDTGRAQSRREQLRQRLRERFAALDGVRPASRAPIDQEIAALIDSVGEADRDAEAHDPAGAAAFPSPAPFDKIQHDLLAPGRALVAFFWGDSAVYGWWVTSNSVRAVRLGRSDSLASVVDFLRTSIDDPTGRVPWTAAARHAYQALVEPLEPDSAAEVLVVADGPLAYVPIEVLVPQTGGQPWGATRSFVYGPSAGVLHALTVAPTGRGWSRSMLAVGDPQAPTRWWSRLLGSQMNDGWAPLPYSAAEVRQVAGLFDTGDADLLIGSSATVERWRELGPGRYRYLHFAAHAAISDRVAAQSALVLAGGVLDLPAIRRLQLTADLVTLSACETGLGQRIRGEGVLGLPHAFLAAGARGVVVTLWRVTDRSAADFMQEFYRELRAGRSPAAALLAVRRAHLTASGPASLPYHWAPFVLVGGIAGGGH
jgi:CHAT domain-containing protein